MIQDEIKKQEPAVDEACTCSLEYLMERNRVKLTRSQTFYLKWKRFFDVVIALAAMLLLWPLFLVISLMIKLDSPAERVIFKQERIGQGGTTFCMYKFRTMKSTAPEKSTRALTDADQYITRVGYFLRRYSLDELPQIWNVLNGSMSLIGPRPLIKNEDEIHYLRRYYGVYQVKPGITGLAQINGRDIMECYEKVRWDREYVRRVSLLLDFQILLVTVGKVLRHADIIIPTRRQKPRR